LLGLFSSRCRVCSIGRFAHEFLLLTKADLAELVLAADLQHALAPDAQACGEVGQGQTDILARLPHEAVKFACVADD
jgi:hypothetical protein